MNARALVYDSAGALRAPWRILFFLTLASIVGAVASLVLTPLETPFASGGVRNETISSLVGVIGAVGGSWLMLRYVDRKSFREIGLQRSAASPTRLLGGFALGALGIGLPIVVLIAVGWLRYRPIVVPSFGHPLVWLTMLLLVAALGEELVTRGYLLTVLRDAWGWPAAVLVTSVVFGLLHLGNDGVTGDDTPLGGVTIKLFMDVDHDNGLTANDGAAIAMMDTAAPSLAVSPLS